MSSNTSFITNEQGQRLIDRFNALIKDSASFDCLVGYFYASGFHALYRALENTKKIRILIGIDTDRETFEMLDQANTKAQSSLPFSHAEAKEEVENRVEQEMAESPDTKEVEEGVKRFVDWIRQGKIEIKACPDRRLHAKLYIITFKEGDRDEGRVITGSSNFTQSGLAENLEFNV